MVYMPAHRCPARWILATSTCENSASGGKKCCFIRSVLTGALHCLEGVCTDGAEHVGCKASLRIETSATAASILLWW